MFCAKAETALIATSRKSKIFDLRAVVLFTGNEREMLFCRSHVVMLNGKKEVFEICHTAGRKSVF
ncbi:MAG TPA: hypothetical protein VFL47_13505, partial [Flavisolibacter sp.]|nr:hypothetical protein [Flavisolibacter sp.]